MNLSVLQEKDILAALHLILPDRLHIMNLASTANAAG